MKRSCLRLPGLPAGVLAFVVGFVALSVPAWSAFDDPEPNQNCGASSDHSTNGNPDCQTGTSTMSQWHAEIAASSARDADLAYVSGVVCKICWNGVQCSRSVTLGTGSTSMDCTSSGGTWTCVSCFTGDYSVKCAKCPRQPVEGEPH